MAIPGNMWLYDDGGALIKGGCDVAGRECSIEFKGFQHNLFIPTDDQSLKSAEIKWYKVNDAGQEVEYFNMLLEGVRIVSISPTMASPEDKNNNHLESVELRYEKITWKHCDGNIIFTDAWNERQTA